LWATTKKTFQDPDLARVEAALQRAGASEREIARQTGTPLVISKNGRTVLQPVEEDTFQKEL